MRFWLFLLLALSAAGPARAEEDASLLTPRQRWEKLSDADKEHLRENFKRFKAMDRDERQHVVEQFSRFKRLPSTERQAILERHRKFQSLTPAQQNGIRERFQKFQKLPRRERMDRLQKLRNRRSNAERNGSRLPDSGGTDRPRLQRPLRRNK